MVHDPDDAPPAFDGWVVHGHLHDSDLRRFPFFDPASRRINVSVETAGYAPVPLSQICDADPHRRAVPVPVRSVPQHPPGLKGPDTSLHKA